MNSVPPGQQQHSQEEEEEQNGKHNNVDWLLGSPEEETDSTLTQPE